MDTAAELENARALRRLGRHKAAADICQRILDRQPSRSDALLVLGEIAVDLGDLKAAIAFLTRIVDRDPTYPGAAVPLAGVLTRLGVEDGAIAWYRAALELDEGAEGAAPALARLLAGRGEIDPVLALADEQLGHAPHIALDVARAGLAASPGHPGLALAEGRALIAIGALNEAQTPLRLAAAAAPGEAETAAALSRAKRGDAAWLSRALAIRPNADIRAELGEALTRDGKIAEARRHFEASLADDRNHGPSQRGLARLKLVDGDADAAIGIARRRLADAPEDTETATILGEALTRRGLATSALTFASSAAKAGREDTARSIAMGIVAADPDQLDAWRMIATPRAFRVAIVHQPTDASAMTGLASAGSAGEAAQDWLERALHLDGKPATVLALARALVRTGAKEAAKELLRSMLATVTSGSPAQVAEFAELLADVGETETAVRLLELLTTTDPDNDRIADQLIRAHGRAADVVALIRLGQAHLDKGRPTLASAALAAARRLKPDNPQIAFLHGRALWDAEKKGAAVDAFVDAADLAGDENLDLLTRAGELLVALQAADLGLSYLRRTVDRDFTNPDRHSYSYFFNFLNQCDWPARTDYIRRLTDLAEAKIAADDPHFRLNPSLWVFLGAERDLLYRSANHFARHTFPTAAPRPRVAPGTDPERPIRLAYMSAFLHGHHIGFSLTGIVEAHDRNAVQVYLYGQNREDSIQAALKRHAHAFRPIDGKSPAAIAQMIAADGIDVLVDLDGYVNGASGLLTLEVANRRPAPIQMLYHNYVGPTGTGFVDYVVADRELLDAHDDAGYRERLIRLPPCYYPAAPLPKAQIQTERRSWGLPEQGAVFCNFGHFYKVEPSSFDVWMRILRRVPGSVLWMNHWDTPAAVANLRREAEARGVDPARLVFSALAEKPMHLARLALADVFLDTLVYASGVTSLDVLWGGVPVLTVRGSTFARRVGASLNAGLALDDLTCADVGAYEELAVALATDPARLAALKTRLKANLATQSLFDRARLARNLERAYRVAFRRDVAGLPPESFELAP